MRNSPYAVMISESLQYAEDYYYSEASTPPWLGQGTCYMTSGAWTKLYEDHYLTGGEAAVTPKGYKFRNDGILGTSEHVFSTLSNENRTEWSTLGEPGRGMSDEDRAKGCVKHGWAAYSGGQINVKDCPSTCSTGLKDTDTRDIQTIYESNQQDIFGLSFHSMGFSILMGVLDTRVVNAEHPDDMFNESPVDLKKVKIGDQLEIDKIGSFTFAALGEYFFGSNLFPLSQNVAQSCARTVRAAQSIGICYEISNICENTFCSVCGNPFMLDVILPDAGTSSTKTEIPITKFLDSEFDALGLDSLMEIVGSDRNVNCNSWKYICGECV